MRSSPTPLILPVLITPASTAILSTYDLPAAADGMDRHLESFRGWMRKRAGSLFAQRRTDASTRLSVRIPTPFEPRKEVEALDIADENLLASPPLSPSSSCFSLSSRPPSLTFDLEPSYIPPVRSSAYAHKVGLLNGALAIHFPHLQFSQSDREAAREHGLRFIEAEERYELEYERRRKQAKGKPETRAVRRQRWSDRIVGYIREYAKEKAEENAAAARRRAGILPSPALPRLLQYTIKRDSFLASSLSTSYVDSRSSTTPYSALPPVDEVSLLDLPSLRSQLSRPPPPRMRDTYKRRRRAVYNELKGAEQPFLLRWQQLAALERLQGGREGKKQRSVSFKVEDVERVGARRRTREEAVVSASVLLVSRRLDMRGARGGRRTRIPRPVSA
ncbi:hypothetical protein JCM10213_007476 [Rhodosporidiobolus nylandii]